MWFTGCLWCCRLMDANRHENTLHQPTQIPQKTATGVIVEIHLGFDREEYLAIELIDVAHSGEIRRLVAEFDLCRSKYSRFVFKDVFKSVFETLCIARLLGPWTDDGHITDQDVPKLWQLIQLCRSQQAADSCHPRIAVERQLKTVGAAVLVELAEFVHPKGTPAKTKPCMGEEDGSPTLQNDRKCDKRHQR